VTRASRGDDLSSLVHISGALLGRPLFLCHRIRWAPFSGYGVALRGGRHGCIKLNNDIINYDK
jgi:hypothetical protein